ncbi:MAG TPA: PqqD family protein [Acidimicrobiia bacterium]|nr:PqqD family protein [Acidimicrobiia bacterium]
MTPLRRGEVFQQTGQTGTAVYEAESDGLHVLNASAFAIWELCDGQTTLQEMAAAIAELTGLEIDVAATEVAATIEVLSQLGLVVT